jgi:2-methylaconitate cis-trans-isomerase PrpF
MPQLDLPCILMRGGTSKGPYFNAADLPSGRDALGRILIAAIGAGHPLNIDGIGAGNAVTTKVAMLSPSEDAWADVDYFFAQVAVNKELVDFAPTCGNILAGVGPASLEMGLLPVSGDETKVRIRSVNTGTLVEAIVRTPDGAVTYEGDARIDGVPGSAAPVLLNFMNVIGSQTGQLLPTGQPADVLDGVAVSCIDAAVPLMIARAEDLEISGYESREELDSNRALFARMEALRLKAGALMGLGDVSKSVVPRMALLAAPRQGGSISARYFMPWAAHPAYSVTGSICTGACLLVPGTVAEGLAEPADTRPTPVRIEHPGGAIDVVFDWQVKDGAFDLKTAGLLRTARKLFSGTIHVPLHDG